MSAKQVTDREESGRTVFICSRIDSLANERRAAYRALHANGWAPLIYEAEISRIPRATIDVLIDQSSRLLLILSESAGHSDRNFHGMKAIEYEVYRFAANFFVAGDCGKNTLPPLRADVDSILQDGGQRKQVLEFLKRAFSVSVPPKPGSPEGKLRSRMWIYSRPPTRKAMSGNKFLSFLENPEKCVSELETWISNAAPVKAPHVDLFGRIGVDVGSLTSNTRRSEDNVIKITADVPDTPGSLRRLLYQCLRCGLNLGGLFGQSKSTGRIASIELFAQPYSDSTAKVKDLAEIIEREIQLAFDVDSGPIACDVAVIESYPAGASQSFCAEVPDNFCGDGVELVVNVIDVPGALWSVVSHVDVQMRGEANIDYFLHQRPRHLMHHESRKRITLGLRREGGNDGFWESRLNLLEYVLSALPWVSSARFQSYGKIRESQQH